MKVFTPRTETTFPLHQRDRTVYRILRGGEPYLVNDLSGEWLDACLRDGSMKGTLTEAEPPPFKIDPERRLVFFYGEAGDAACTRLADIANLGRSLCDFVTAQDDAAFFPRSSRVFEYPVPLRLAQCYDSWLDFDARADPQREPMEAFAEAVGVAGGPADHWQPPGPCAWAPGTGEAMIPHTGRKRLGVIVSCDSHYRSWNGVSAYAALLALVEAGYDCYLIGPVKQRLIFEVAGEEKRFWGEGIYDTCGVLTSPAEQASFLCWMHGIVSVDGGMLQVACAMQKPTLGLFGPTRGEARSKYAPTLRWINADHESGCAPCWCRGDSSPCQGDWCRALAGIRARQVVEALQSMLEASDAQA